MENAEKFAWLTLLTSGQPYSNTQFEGIWKKLLFDDFHGIMPGSGVGNNYVEALRILNEASLESGKILNNSLDTLTANIDTRGAGVPVVVFNPLSWQQTEPVTLEIHTPAPGQQLEVLGAGGRPLLSQVISTDSATHRTRLQVMVKEVRSLGYAVIHVLPVTHVQPAAFSLKVNGMTIENQFFRVKIDPRTGCVVSLVNKSSNKEAVAPGGCGDLLQTFVDRPPVQDAWSVRFIEKGWDLTHPLGVRVSENGPERVVIEIKNKFQNSDFVRHVVMHPNMSRTGVHMKVNWHERHILLKVGSPVNVQATKATFEIPFGTIERPTTRNTPAERTQSEVSAERWGDISDTCKRCVVITSRKLRLVQSWAWEA